MIDVESSRRKFFCFAGGYISDLELVSFFFLLPSLPLSSLVRAEDPYQITRCPPCPQLSTICLGNLTPHGSSVSTFG